MSNFGRPIKPISTYTNLPALTLQQAARAIKARLQLETAPQKPTALPTPVQPPAAIADLVDTHTVESQLNAADMPTGKGMIYKYRSRASRTYTNLPAMVVNE